MFGVTQHPYIVLAVNAFVLLGLRALFFLVAGLLDRLVYLSSGLALILAFIGIKLILHFAQPGKGAARPGGARPRGLDPGSLLEPSTRLTDTGTTPWSAGPVAAILASSTEAMRARPK